MMTPIHVCTRAHPLDETMASLGVSARGGAGFIPSRSRLG